MKRSIIINLPETFDDYDIKAEAQVISDLLSERLSYLDKDERNQCTISVKNDEVKIGNYDHILQITLV